MKNNKTPAKKHPKRQRVQITSWVKPPIKEELETIAKQEKISVSALIAVLVEEALRQRLHIRSAAILEPVIVSAIDRKMQATSHHQTKLLERILFAVEHDRALTYNTLGKMPGVTPDMLYEIADEAAASAKRKISRLLSDVNRGFDKTEKPN